MKRAHLPLEATAAGGAGRPAGRPYLDRPVLPPSPHPARTRPYQPGLAERLYLPLLGGLWVTLRHFVRNLFHGPKYIIEYPEERREYSHRRLGYRPRYPEEEAQRARMRRDAFNLVEAARQAKQREEHAAAKAG